MGLRRSDLLVLMFALAFGGLIFICFNALDPGARRELPFLPMKLVDAAIGNLPREKAEWLRDLVQAPAGGKIAFAQGDTAAGELMVLPDTTMAAGAGSGMRASGTGFFVSLNGNVLTAAHILRGCRTIRVSSRYIPMTTVELVAVDQNEDLALLLAAHTQPPAALGLAAQPSLRARLQVYGYPAGGDALTPVQASATLSALDEPFARSRNGRLLRIEALDVRRGFSGGPVLGPRGGVIGLVEASVLNTGYAAGPSGIVVGPGARSIAAFLARVAPAMPMVDTPMSSDSAQRAVVRVLCMK